VEDHHLPADVVVWIDHTEARVFHVHPDSIDETTVHGPHQHVHRHPPGRGEPHEHPDDSRRYFTAVAHALAGVREALVIGPGEAMRELYNHLHDHHPAIQNHVIAVEPADRLTDGQIVARARAFFNARARMQ
jgi:stalled ribosome rescue protein Dom34